MLVGVVVLAIAGLWSNYRELLLLAVVGFMLLVVGFLLPRFSTDIESSRRMMRVLVQRGEPIEMKLTVTADRPLPRLAMTDQVGGVPVDFEVPSLTPSEPVEVAYSLKAERRGVHVVGPLREERRDPFDLAVRTSRHEVIDEIMVHPVVHTLGRTDNRDRKSVV